MQPPDPPPGDSPLASPASASSALHRASGGAPAGDAPDFAAREAALSLSSGSASPSPLTSGPSCLLPVGTRVKQEQPVSPSACLSSSQEPPASPHSHRPAAPSAGPDEHAVESGESGGRRKPSNQASICASLKPETPGAAASLSMCDAAVVIVVDLNRHFWRNRHLAFCRDEAKKGRGAGEEEQPLLAFLHVLECALCGFVRALTLLTPCSEVAVVGMNERTSAVLVAGRVPNLLVEAAGLGGFFSTMMARVAQFAAGLPLSLGPPCRGSTSVETEERSASLDRRPRLGQHGSDQVKRVKTERAEADGSVRVKTENLESAKRAAPADGLAGRSRWDAAPRPTTACGEDSMLAGALSLALCCLNKVSKRSARTPERRVLILDGSLDRSYSSQYMPLMNLAFAAAKGNIVIDCCALSTNPSTIPEQLCDISRGVHLKFAQAAPSASTSGSASLDGGLALLQLLLFWIFPSMSLRPAIAALSVHRGRSNTAVCFCHHKPVEVCCICSCCLAIYCSEKDAQTGKERISCDVCKSRFSRGLLKNKMAGGVDLPNY
ncbi:general transcription factor IIH polypeptide 3 GTF2H3 [Toxoplasma gondii VEG]|uniref:General transcription factor IIH polypeptide 3 GTF2H3 n=1 Tax=Toxoplasma gondii (strain ATCC 50861 / VEG) TaxID=432359 RepID=V5BDN4_TOXGV|nr:general transcription factor IIH polypeptide 3 GTF2H3 [Toxoplasma gondii VEG]